MIYSALVTEVVARSFPEGIAENLETIYAKRVLDGLIELQRWVPYFKLRQFNLIPYSSTLYRQGATIVNAPHGQVKRVAVFGSKTLRDIIYYDPCTRNDVDRLLAAFSRSRGVSGSSWWPNAFLHEAQKYPDAATVQVGYFNADSVTDKGFRSERGNFCIDDKQLWLLPNIESVERVLIEWTGSKTSYAAADALDFGPFEAQALDALSLYLKKEVAVREDRDTGDFVALRARWIDAIGSLKIDAKQIVEAEPVDEDIGAISRVSMPAVVFGCLPGCDYDASAAYFQQLWLLLPTDGKFYEVTVAFLANTITLSVAGQPGGNAELTYETVRLQKLFIQATSDLLFHRVKPVISGPNILIDVADDPTSSYGKTVCLGVCAKNVDILNPVNNLYYRLSLRLTGGLPEAFFALAPIDVTAPVISAVVVTPATTTTTIAWTTDTIATSKIEWGTSVSYGNELSDDTLLTAHSLIATPLVTATAYFYRITSADQSGNASVSTGTFTTT